MVDVRFETQEDLENDCLTVVDNLDQLRNGFDSEIVLAPLEDASLIVSELNVQCAVNQMLIEKLEVYEATEDIMYWIQDIVEDLG